MRQLVLTYIMIVFSFAARSQEQGDSVIVIKAMPVQLRAMFESATLKGSIRQYNFDYDLFPTQVSTLKHHLSVKPYTEAGIIAYPVQKLKPSTWKPLMDFNGFGGNTDNFDPTIGYRTGAGVQWNGHYKDAWNFYLRGVSGIYDGDSSYRPRSYFNWREGSNRLYTDIRSRVSFSPNRIFNFQAGLDHNFIGEGSRSLFLSDYGNPYPFGMIRANFWRVQYTVLYQFMREGTQGNWNGKFASAHHISFNAAKWLNIGVFETVIFNPSDTLLGRGFDVEYLNPVVFYRPQEYALGSADNVLLGLDLTARLKNFTIYSQFIIDEFFLEEIRARTQWWANKYGGQFGVKATFRRGNNVFFARTEFNFVRPYTYAHLNDRLNHGNQGAALAHPYGANFAEILGEVRWAKKHWRGQFFVNYSLRGSGLDTFNYGADIYEPYINRPYERGHFIGQGAATNAWLFRWRVARKLPKFFNVSVFAEYNLRYVVQENSAHNLVSLGVRSNLWNDYRNY